MSIRAPIRSIRLRRITQLLAIVAIGSCTDDRELPLAPRASLNGGPHTLSGNILGPDATSICNSIPAGGRVLVRVIEPINATPVFAGAQNLTCPANAYSIEVAPDLYRIRVELPADPGIGQLPWRYLQPGDVDASPGNVVQDIQVLNGTPMGGEATLDGLPLAGVSLGLIYDFPATQQFGAVNSGLSGSDGAWDEPFRSPMRVQGGERYRVSTGCSGALGARVIAGPPSGSFVFPTDVGAIDCTLLTAPAVAYSHERTRLVVTSMPGNIGGRGHALLDQYGGGWGVQFPVDPSQGPVHVPGSASHLFNGGLVIGLEPNVVLSGTDLNTEAECGATCLDLGPGATAQVVTEGDGRKIKWTYSDAQSGDGMGLKIVQQSFDGKPPADYVIFQYTISNQGNATRTFYAGFWGDWDVTESVVDDVGFTELDRRLMYVTGSAGGVRVGTLLLGNAPVSGNFFYNRNLVTLPIPLVDQVGALKGDQQRHAIGPGDTRVFHAMGPITLKRNRSAEVRLAIVAGETRLELLANAAAAAAHVGQALPPTPSFEGSVNRTALDFGDTLVVKPSASLPWDGDEFVSFGEVSSSYLLDATPDSIAVVVPRLPTGPAELLVFNQGPDQVIQTLDVSITSTFTAIGLDQLGAAPDVTNGPFPMSFFVELDNDHRDHVVTVAPSAALPLTVTLDWQTGEDLDIYWMDQAGQNFVGNFDGATLANPEQTSLTVPAGQTWRLRFNKWSNGPSSLARVTITSP